MKKPYCLMPWIHLHVGYNGNAMACCVSSIKYGNINQETVADLWSSEKMENIRTKFLSGESDNRCQVCINRELSGAKSLRQETFEKYPDVKIEQVELPFYFDIRFSNVCNFKCRTCWHGASSKWFEDAKLLKATAGNKAIIKNIKDYNAFIKKNGLAILNAKEIYFAGGEPLVTEEHYLLLQFLLDHQKTDVNLRYNTNFSVLTFKEYDVLTFWSKFSNVEVMASIDESADLGEYIRKGLDWNLFLANRKKLDNHPHITFKIAPTVSVFNVSTLPQFYETCVRLKLIKPNDFYLNILDRPKHFNIKVLPLDRKEKIKANYIEWLEEKRITGLPKLIENQFFEVLNFMLKDDYSKHYPTLVEVNHKLDAIREESFDLF